MARPPTVEYTVTTDPLADGGSHLHVDGPEGRIYDLLVLTTGPVAGVYEVQAPAVQP